MVLDDSVTLPNCFSPELDDFVDKSLNYSDAKIVILGLVFVIYAAQILVNCYQKLAQIEFIYQLVHDFAKFQQTFDDQTSKLWHTHIVFLVFQESEKYYENVCVVTVLQHSQHRRVQVFENQFTFFVLSNFIKVFNQKPGQKLLCKLIDLRLGDFLHDFLGSTSFIHNCDKVLGESQWNILDWVFEDIVHNVRECLNQLVAAFDKGLLLIELFFCQFLFLLLAICAKHLV